MKTEEKNKIWVRAIILDTILTESGMESMGVPKHAQEFIANHVSRTIANSLLIPPALGDELFQHCLWVDKSNQKGEFSQVINDLIGEYLSANQEHIARSIISSCVSMN